MTWQTWTLHSLMVEHYETYFRIQCMTGVFRCIMMHRTSFSAFLSWPTCITAEDSDVSIHLSENTVASVDKTPPPRIPSLAFPIGPSGDLERSCGEDGVLGSRSWIVVELSAYQWSAYRL